MRIIKLGFNYSRSIKVADYKFYKPSVYLEAIPDDDETYEEAREKVKALGRVEMQTLIDEEKILYSKMLEKAQLQRVMKENPSGTTEHLLAKERLEKFEAGELE